MIVIFDLDGTLALIEHRRHLVEGKKKDFPAFYAACVDDEPHEAVIHLFQILKKAGHYMVILSGRSDEVKSETKIWLSNNDVEVDRLIMRKEGDYTPDTELKKAWLHEHFSGYLSSVMCVFDDRQCVVDMWREEGLTCLQVAPGNF